jgi:SHS2 domain-containing protein
MYEIVPHTADVRLRVASASLEDLFEEAGHALMVVSELSGASGTAESRAMMVESVDQTSLLIDFLNELVAILHVEHLAFAGFSAATIEETRLAARVKLARVVGWDEDIKAVTYHEANVTHEGELWRTMIVLDI